MIVGADGIDGMDLLRHGAIPATFGGIRAPSTLGSFLRAFAHSDARQLTAVHRRVLAHLAARTLPLPGADTLALVDINSVQRRVYRASKQGAAFGTPRSRRTSGHDARATGGNAHLWSVFTSYRMALMTRCCPQRATYPPSGCLVSSSMAWECQSSEDTPQRGATPTGCLSSTGTGRGGVSPSCFWTVGWQGDGCWLIGEATS